VCGRPDDGPTVRGKTGGEGPIALLFQAVQPAADSHPTRVVEKSVEGLLVADSKTVRTTGRRNPVSDGAPSLSLELTALFE